MTTTTQEHELIQNQQIGDNFQGIYYVESFYHRLTQHGKDFTDMVLRDRSGGRNVKSWSKVKGVEKGDFVFVSATVEEYNGSPSIIAKNVEREDPPDDLDNYMAAYDDSGEMSEVFDLLQAELKESCKGAGDETAEMLVEEVFRSSAFFTNFISAPGNAMPHYGRRGGLLANTVRVTQAAWKSAKDNGLDDTEKAVVLASGLVCRIGVVDAFEFQDCVPAETKDGILLGVNNLTMLRLANSMKRMVEAAGEREINHDTLVRIIHCMSSYDGIVRPMTKEAIVLSASYAADKDLVRAIDFMANDQNDDEFTAWDPISRRRFFKG
jgi:23S rRNA maturation-related 3'-5' exoribonuclease YhaM